MLVRSGGRGTLALGSALLLATLAGTASAQSLLYKSGFADGASTGWSSSRHTTVRSGNTLLGRFHNEPASLTLSNLPNHAAVVIAFDVHLIGDWFGQSAGTAPTTITVTLDDGTLLHASLANDNGDAARRQSFPGEPGTADHPAALGAYRTNALSLPAQSGGIQRDSVYRLVFTAPHAAAAMNLTVAAAGLPGGAADASWALDNVVVFAVPHSADLESVKALARDAVLRTSLGMPVNATGSPARTVDHRVPTSGLFVPHAADPMLGVLESFPIAIAPADARNLAQAIDDQVAAAPAPSMLLAAATGADGDTLALSAATSALPGAVMGAPTARIEQPVVKRTSNLLYQNRFAQPPGAEWNLDRHGSAPRGEKFLGPLHNDSATLTLRQIPPHDQLVIDADVYTIGDWPGEGTTPSRFFVELDGERVYAHSLATEDGSFSRTQSHPHGKTHLPGADAAGVDSLGFAPPSKDAVGDVHYRLRFVVPHATGAARVRFGATGLPGGPGTASWGIDNVTVVASGSQAMSYSEATGMAPDDNAEDGDYLNPFVREPGDEWNVRELATAPNGERFLGRLHNQAAELTIKNFQPHTHLVLAADVIVTGDWQGNAPDPSRFSITLSDGTKVFSTSFASDNGDPNATQDYPSPGSAKNLPGAGAAAVGTLGYSDSAGQPKDATYRLYFVVPHTEANETIRFEASGLRGDASSAGWGLDNVAVSAIDSNSPMGWAFGGGSTALGDAGALASANPSGGTIGGYPGFDPLGSNPYINPPPVPPYPQNPGGGGGGGGGGPPPPPPPPLPAPGAVPALVAGLATLMLRKR